MTTFLATKLELATERPVLREPVRVRMTITNNSDEELEVANPEVGVPPPDLDWKASNGAYQVALLMSFGLIKISLKDINGRLAEAKGLIPWVTPILSKRTLQARDSLALDLHLNELVLRHS